MTNPLIVRVDSLHAGQMQYRPGQHRCMTVGENEAVPDWAGSDPSGRNSRPGSRSYRPAVPTPWARAGMACMSSPVELRRSKVFGLVIDRQLIEIDVVHLMQLPRLVSPDARRQIRATHEIKPLVPGNARSPQQLKRSYEAWCLLHMATLTKHGLHPYRCIRLANLQRRPGRAGSRTLTT